MKIANQNNTIRIVEKFLWLPVTIKTWRQDYGETRWLEKAKIEQKFYAEGYGIFKSKWRNIQFLNK